MCEVGIDWSSTKIRISCQKFGHNLKKFCVNNNMSFSVYDSDIILCSCETILSFNVKNGEESIQVLPNLVLDKSIKQHNNADIDSFHGITSITFSNDGKYFGVCTNRKQLCLYDRLDRKLISNRTLVRAASRVRFTPNNDVIVADKSGDAYLFSSTKPHEAGELILGHLSMLLDVLVTDDHQHIITADRDEKIRVSKLPNAYNIESYCLGHSNFVSNISQLPHDIDVLISAGGDGEIKFWDYKQGKELESMNFSERIRVTDVENLNNSLLDLELTDPIQTLPVKHLRVNKFKGDSSIVLLTFYGSGLILVYQVLGSMMKSGRVEFLQSTVEESEALEVLFFNNQLWMLFNSGIKVFDFTDNCFVLNNGLNTQLGKVNESWRTLRSTVNKQIFYPILYKRKFDNVQEYKERKKSRLNPAE